MNCSCVRCGMMQDVDENSKTIILSKKLYKELQLPTTGVVTLPSHVTYNGSNYTVVGIDSFLFANNKNIVSVILPTTLKHIGRYAFDGCENLETCDLPEGLLTIRRAAFQCCFKLRNVDFPSTLKWIDDFAYNHCSSLQNTIIELPSGIMKIGSKKPYPAHMFYDCGGDNFIGFKVNNNKHGYKVNNDILYARNGRTLVSIPRGKMFKNGTYVMPNSVINLGELSFSRNRNISKVVISDNLKITGEMNRDELRAYINVGNQLSVGCYAYSTVNYYDVKRTNKRYISLNGILYSKDKKRLIAVPNKYNGIIDIPEGTKIWQKEAIWSELASYQNMVCNQIVEIRVPSTMELIDEEQIEIVNTIRTLYGTTIIVNDKNLYYTTDAQGYLIKK